MTVVFKYEERIDHYGTTLWCEQYASKPSFVKLWRWGVDDKIGGDTLHSKPNMNRLMKTYLAEGEIEVKVVRYKDVHSAFNSKGDVKEYIINNNLNESYRPQHNDDIETIELYIYDKSTLDKLFNEYNDYTVLVNKPSMNIRDGKYRDVDNFVEYDVNSDEFEFAVRRLESAYSSIVAKINHYDKTIMIYSIRLRWPTFESANSKRLNESFEDIVKEVANYVLSNNDVNGNTSVMTIDRLIRDAYFELYGEEMESDNKSLYRAIRNEIMFNNHSLRESYDEDIDYEMSQFIKAVQKRRGTYSAKSYDGKLKVGDKVVVNSDKGLIDGVISDFDVNIMTGGETVEIEYWNEEKKSKWTMCGVPISRVKKVDEELNESSEYPLESVEETILEVVNATVNNFNQENRTSYNYEIYDCGGNRYTPTKRCVRLYIPTRARGEYYNKTVGTLVFFEDEKGLSFATSRGGVWDGDVKEYINYDDIESKTEKFVLKMLNHDLYMG